MVSNITNGYGANPYVPAPTTPLNNSVTGGSGQSTGAASGTSNNGGPSVNVTLSAEARAALAAQTDNRSIDSVVTSARSALDKLLSEAKAPSALKDGKPTINVASLDRRTLYAIASNKGGKFSIEEQVVASLQMKATRDTALAPATSVMRVTGDYAGLYKSALANLEAAGPEERSTAQWAKDKAALTEGLKQATDKPGVAPSGIEGDPVAAYLKENGGVVANPRGRDIEKVASDVRTVLDKQYDLAFGEGMATSPDGGKIDFSKFDDRSLAAVALNKGDQFSEHEVAQATAEIRNRNRDNVSGAFAEANGSGDTSAFGKSLITRYASMSSEERDAVGWTPALYSKMLAMQNMSSKLDAMFNDDGSMNGVSSLLDYI